MIKRITLFIMIGSYIVFNACSKSMSDDLNTESHSPQNSSLKQGSNEGNNIVSSSEEIIWEGESESLFLVWTTSDLYVKSKDKIEKIWSPLAKSGLTDFLTVSFSDKDNIEKLPPFNCSYERSFQVMSIVGTLISFIDYYYDYCGGAHPSIETRFTTIDLAKSGKLIYKKSESTPMMDINLDTPSKVSSLTDFFSEQEVLESLSANALVKDALIELGYSGYPKTLSEFRAIFAQNRDLFGSSGFELRSDFLTRFVFHHIEGSKVVVRIGLPPYSTVRQSLHKEIDLILPIPINLKEMLSLADDKKQGFLMKDAAIISKDRKTVFKFKADKDTLKYIGN